jgi:large subunit ribosomal protein L15
MKEEFLKNVRKDIKRVGRGPGSKHGKTSGRGMSGQKSRSGSSFKLTFEGGQVPFARKIKKVGFKHENNTTVIKLGDLVKQNINNLVLSYKNLELLGFKPNDRFKIIYDGTASIILTVLKSDINIKFSQGVIDTTTINYI